MKKLLLVFGLVLLGLSLSACNKPAPVGDMDLFKSGLLAVELNHKWGYVDEKGDVIIEFLYDGAGAFYKETAIVELNDEVLLINKKGVNVLDKKYQRLFRDYETGLIVYYSSELCGLMDEMGKPITEGIYDNISEYSEGFAVVVKNNAYGFMNQKGKLAIEMIYEEASRFSNGLAAVKKNNKWGYINSSGEEVINFTYDQAGSFDLSNRAIVEDETEDKQTLIDKTGTIIITGDYINTRQGPIYAVSNDHIIKIYDKDGKLFHDQEYGNPLTTMFIVDGYTATLKYSDDQRMNVWFNEDGTIFKEALYEESFIETNGEFIDEPYLVEQDGLFIKVTTKTKEYRFQCDRLRQMLPNSSFVVETDNKYGIINEEGEVKLDLLYDMLFYTSDEYYLFSQNNLIGAMDKSLKIIFDAKYEDFALGYNIYR